ncbi:MAG: four helix bundle protein [Saprospiraceae bacterium]|nr:four helix bundle protein [Saprospiraceae bacterium]
MEKNLIVEKTTQFSLDIIDYCESLLKKRKFSIADQLERASTSIGANVRESQNPYSMKDFCIKLLAKKKPEQNIGWNFARKVHIYRPGSLPNDLESILRILGKIISTSTNKTAS